jgi:hypothetical protein
MRELAMGSPPRVEARVAPLNMKEPSIAKVAFFIKILYVNMIHYYKK